MGPSVCRSILGVGLNVNQTHFDPTLPNPTSMALEAGRVFAREQVLEGYLTCSAEWFGRLVADDREAIDRRYRQSLYRRTGEHFFAEPGGEAFTASIDTVEPTGELVLRRTDGIRKSYLFKEIEFL